MPDTAMARDPYRYFRVEGRQLLDQLVKGVLDLDKGLPDASRISQLLRLAHTLKGAARVVKQIEISELAHAIEDALAPHREGERPIERERIDGLLATLDLIETALRRLPEAEAEASGPTSTEQSLPAPLEFAEVEDLMDSLGEVQGEFASMRQVSAAAQRTRLLVAQLVAQLASMHGSEPAHTAGRKTGLYKARSAAETVLDEMVVIEKRSIESVGRAERELRQAREQAERMRLTPTGAMFNALERLTRDCAQSAGRRVSFSATGGDVRLDRKVLEAVQDALIQVVRNAVAHGIEPEAQRERAGKPKEGRILLDVSRHGHQVTFRCRDDGRGVDLEAVRQALKRKGRLPETSGQLGAAALMQLLMQGGTSTASTVTELSGRGIGMDVVREAVERLGGEVTMSTAPGSGTTVTLSVPISMASVDALIVAAGEQSFAIPLEAVRAAMRVVPSEVIHSPEGDSIVFGDRLCALIPLAALLSRQHVPPRATAFSAVIVADGSQTMALAVDRVADRQTITLRSLPKLAVTDGMVQGAYLDGDGNPRPILEPKWLVNSLQGRILTPDAPTRGAPRPVLVIDDSITTRMLEHSILESAGYQVDVASSGEEALIKAQQSDYGLFLVDVEMPGMDGFTFIERSRADPALREVPCILVTSRDEPQDRQRADVVGARAYIVKSEFNQVQFLDRVASLVRR